jgi:tetratricopeptide (TPR) repeat protein
MSLLIKALQKAEKSKEGNDTSTTTVAGSAALELAPHHDEIDSHFSLADEGGFSEPAATPAAKAATPAAKPDVPEREAAANLFRARSEGAGSNPGGRRAFVLGLGGLALLLLLGAGFYFYLDSLQQPELVIARPAPIRPTEAKQPEAPPAAPATPAVVAEATPAATTATPPAPPTPSTPAATVPAETSKAAPNQPAEPPLAEAEPTPAAKTPSPARPAKKVAGTDDSAPKVTRNRVGEPVTNPTALAAYQAFMAGDDATASRLYRQLLQTEPRNIDALLGLAATSARQENNDEAARLYMRALELEPRNSIAQAGIIALVGQADPVAAESRLKSLLAQQPEAAYLHAALGGVYAEQNQWANAQQAYFQAFRLDPSSAEYAFNLAVSLDQLGKPDLALDYYQRARDMLPKQGGAVGREALETRISQLRSALGK